MTGLSIKPRRAPQPETTLRPATLADVAAMEVLMVALAPDGGIVGTGSLKVYSTQLAEIAGLAVRDDQQGRGVGKALIEALLIDARALGLNEVFGLTRKPLFFMRLGFRVAEKEQFPLKVWADCARCPRQHACDEVAVALKL